MSGYNVCGSDVVTIPAVETHGTIWTCVITRVLIYWCQGSVSCFDNYEYRQLWKTRTREFVPPQVIQSVIFPETDRALIRRAGGCWTRAIMGDMNAWPVEAEGLAVLIFSRPSR